MCGMPNGYQDMQSLTIAVTEFFTQQRIFVPALQQKVFDRVQFPNSKQATALRNQPLLFHIRSYQCSMLNISLTKQ